MREGYAEYAAALKSASLRLQSPFRLAQGNPLLIVPLHRGLSRATFPVVTLVLILINCFVYMFLQSGDARVERRAAAYYYDARLERVEFPAFEKWIESHERDERMRMAMREAPPEFKLRLLQGDAEFLAQLHADKLIEPGSEGYANWRDKRAEFDRLWDAAFTNRYDLRFSEIAPLRMLTAMFLHGSAGHLIGNMIFLALLGLLVEAALGPWLFLAVYLGGGMGAQLVSLAWRWGEHGGALGASGAIAALMGAYCVIWGLRKVRVFYWALIVFDYVRVPALLLLPVWFGWEFLNLLFNRGAHVGFDAHAGGILCGGLLAFAVRRAGWERRDFLDEDVRSERRDEAHADLERALRHLGKLEIAPAREILLRLDRDEPGQFAVLVALYRCARYGGKPVELDAAARRLFARETRRSEELRELKAVFDDYFKACDGAPRLPNDMLLTLARQWLRIDADADAERILRALVMRMPAPAGLDAAWLEFARRAPESSAARRERCEFILRHFAQSDIAPKVRFLLDQA